MNVRVPTAALTMLTLALLGTACASESSDNESSADTTATSLPSQTGQGVEADCDGTVEAPDTGFVVDDCGRVVILRGVNVESSSKGASQDDSHLPASGMEMQRHLSNWGWNNVRFLVFWGAIEPTEGTYDEAYLDEVESWMDYYESKGIHVVLDMHQDLYGWAVGFDGAPDWAVDTRGVEPGEVDANVPWYLKGADPAVQNAYQSFWNPTPEQPDLKGAWLGALTHLAERFADHPAVIGYDVMNEPAFANGDLAATLAIQGDAAAGTFRNEVLTEFMQGGIDAVRAVDDDAYVFIEPTSLLNVFPYAGDLDASKISDPRSGPPRLVYAGHLYEPSVHDGAGYPTASTYVEDWQALRVSEARGLNASLWFGEWGGPPDQDGIGEYVADVLTMSDATMSGWAWWSWDPGGWSPITETGEVSPNGEHLLWVQPRAVSGTPTRFGFDPTAKRFVMEWDERSEAVGATEIAVPAALFGDGVRVVLDDEVVADPDWDAAASVLRVDADRSAAKHSVCVEPAGGTTC